MDFKPKHYLVINWKRTKSQEVWYSRALRYTYRPLDFEVVKFYDGITNGDLLPQEQFKIVHDYGWIDTYDLEDEVHHRYKREFPPVWDKPVRDGAWIDRKGHFFRCPHMSHWGVARYLAIGYCGAEDGIGGTDAEDLLINRGWMELWYTGQSHFTRPLTKSQIKTLGILSKLTGDSEYVEMVELSLRKSALLAQKEDAFELTVTLLGGK